MSENSTDIVIVGAGASGLLAAVAARRLGREVLVIEADDRVGGATALSDGIMWLPAAAGGKPDADSVEDGRTYLDTVLGAPTLASTPQRRDAFVRTAPLLAKWLRSSKLILSPVKGLPDHDQSAPGARRQGRSLQTPPVDKRRLGEWAVRIKDAPDPVGGPRSPREVATAVTSAAWRLFRRKEFSSGGTTLVAELLRRAVGSGVTLWLSTNFTGLIEQDGRVAGVTVERGGESVEVRSTIGVLLACGGFEASQDLRGEYLPLPTDAAWSTTGVANRGAGLTAAIRIGATAIGMDDAWWSPTIRCDGIGYAIDAERSLPHGVIVDQAGDRFVNEAAPGTIVGRMIYERNRGMRAVPSYLIVDNRHRQNYPLGPWPAGVTPRRALDTGDIVKASTLIDLAQKLGVDRAGLLGTVVRFNGFAGRGKDLDFRRGETAGERYRGDTSKRRNPCLGGVEKGPYWAVKVYPGDEGTKGGLQVDEYQRVLRAGGEPIEGLFACGGTAASLMGRGNPGVGAALGASLVEAYRAALWMTGQLQRLEEATS
jgi:3-oxosteroid 1-dehydrogenase